MTKTKTTASYHCSKKPKRLLAKVYSVVRSHDFWSLIPWRLLGTSPFKRVTCPALSRFNIVSAMVRKNNKQRITVKEVVIEAGYIPLIDKYVE